ncbi:MAG: ureidoglycolate lyase [bacterium]|nr:ureidoglycolate lyase [bacterium]
MNGESTGVRRLAVERLDRAAFEPFGAVIAPETADSPNLNRASNNLGYLWVQKELEFPGRAYMCSLRYYYRGNRCEFVQRHPASTVTLITLGMHSAAFVAVPDVDGRPDVDAARAFLITGGTGVVINRGTWVRYAYPLGAYVDFAYVTQRVDPATANTTDDVVRVNLDSELGFVFDLEFAPPADDDYQLGPSGAVVAGPPQDPPGE